MPATAETIADIPHAAENTTTETPSDCAACWSNSSPHCQGSLIFEKNCKTYHDKRLINPLII